VTPWYQGRRRLPVILQTELAECGLACLAMIAGYHGLKTDLNALRYRYPASIKGMTLKSLIRIADRLGMTARPVRLEPAELKRLRMPCLLHWEMNHFVVLREARKGYCIVHDPARGERRFSPDELSERFTGIALELAPNRTFEVRDERTRMRLSDLCGRITGLRAPILQTLVLSAIVHLLLLAAPFYMQLVVDEVVTRSDADLLLVLAVGFGLMMLINQAATALRAWVILHAGSLLGFEVMSNLFGHLLRLPIPWYTSRHVGDVLSRFASTGPVREFLTEGLVSACIDSAMAFGTLTLMVIYSPSLGALATLAAALYATLRVTMYRALHRGNEARLVAAGKEQSTFIESVRSIQSVRLFGCEAHRHSLWQNRYAAVLNCNVQIGRLRIGFEAANGLLFGLENIAVVYLGALQVMSNALSLGMLFAFMAYKRIFVERIGSLIERLIAYRLLDLHLERVADIALSPADPPCSDGSEAAGGTKRRAGGSGVIQICNLSFRHAADESWLLDNASLRIGPAEFISIVGASGSGKTTLLKIMLGLFHAERGQLLYDGLPIERYGWTAFRRKIGTVMQDDALLSGSIADNIGFFDPTPDIGRIRECCRCAAIHDDIAAMPMAYESLVGDMGCALSAGQRQRVLLARALYRKPKVLILDEGTAHLDAATETSIIRTLRRLHITCISVAHRQRPIMASDRVVLLRSGTLHELDKKQLFAPSRGKTGASETVPLGTRR